MATLKLILINHFTVITHEGFNMGWKEKEWKKNQNKKHEGEESPREIEIEMLRMQGLILCDECLTPYSLYQPLCPNCGETNKSHYPAKV